MVIVKSFGQGRELHIADTPEELKSLLDLGKTAIPCLDNNSSESWPHTDYAITDLDEVEDEDLFRIYQRVKGEPWDILVTERTFIRETTIADVDDFYRIYAEPSITEYMESLYENPEEERLYTRNYIKDVYGFYGYGMWTILSKFDNQVIGRAGLYPREGYDSPEMGFVIDKAYQGQGIAYEVCSAILEYGHKKLDFQLIRAKVMPDNCRSIRLLKKLGFIIATIAGEDGMLDCEHTDR